MPEHTKYVPGTSHLVDYAIEYYGAEVIGVEYQPETRPPFSYIMGASNTTCEAKIQKKCTYQILAFGDDTLELNFGIDVHYYPDEFQRLREVKKEIQAGGYKLRGGKEVEWFGEKFMLLGRGSPGGYEFFLQNGDIILWLMPEARGGKPSPELRARLLSSFIWREGEVNAYNRLIEYVNQWAAGNYIHVSRVDPCVDLAVSLPEIDVKKDMVSKIRKKANWERGEYAYSLTTTGKTFGAKGIAYVRIYDKVRQSKEKKLEHMLPVWEARGYIDNSPATRLEYELRNDGLKYFEKGMSFETYLQLRPDIWNYLTHDYLRIIEPGSATRRERCKVTPWWEDYQACTSLFGERTGILPYKVKNPEAIPLIIEGNGCYASAYAKLAADFGETEALKIIEKQSGMKLSAEIIKAGKARIAKYSHFKEVKND